MTDKARLELKRARWRRNKRAARAKIKGTNPAPSPEYVTMVLAERDRRSHPDAEREIWMTRERTYWTTEGRKILVNRTSGRSWISFVADVWAARTLHEAQHGSGSATPTTITNWLIANGRLHDYAERSVRPMVYRAIQALEALETTKRSADSDDPIWPPLLDTSANKDFSPRCAVKTKPEQGPDRE